MKKISLAGVARVVEVSERWLQNHVNEPYTSIPLEFWEACQTVFPKAKHHAAGKESGKTNAIYKSNQGGWVAGVNSPIPHSIHALACPCAAQSEILEAGFGKVMA